MTLFGSHVLVEPELIADVGVDLRAVMTSKGQWSCERFAAEHFGTTELVSTLVRSELGHDFLTDEHVWFTSFDIEPVREVAAARPASDPVDDPAPSTAGLPT